MRVAEDLVDGVNGPDGHVRRNTSLDHKIPWHRAGPGGHQRVHLVTSLQPVLHAPEPVRLGEVRRGHSGGEPGEHLVVRARDRDPAPVAAFEMPVGTGVRGADAFTAAHRAARGISGRQFVENTENWFVQAEIDDLPAPAGIARPQRHQHADRAVHARHIVAERGRAGRHRRSARHPGEMGQATEGMGDSREAGTLAIRPGLTVAGDAQHHDAGIDARQNLIAEPPLLHRAGPEVLAYDVGLLDQPQEQFLPLAAAQIERHRPLVPRLRQPSKRAVVACGRGAVAAPRIAGTRLFDLDHLRAELAQDGGGERCGDEGRHIEHPNARHRQSGLGRSLFAHREPSATSGLFLLPRWKTAGKAGG